MTQIREAETKASFHSTNLRKPTMAHKEKSKETHVRPGTNHPTKPLKHRWIRWVMPITGLVSLMWLLLRVIPKPSRATYPCQRLAAPLASGFIIWTAGLVSSALAYRRAKKFFHKSRYIIAGICVVFSISAVWLPLIITGRTSVEAAFTPVEPANSPMGIAKGIHPGRVVWVHEPSATKWDGLTGRWWDDENTDQATVDLMVSKSIQSLTGEPNDRLAWDALFRQFNQTSSFGDIGYQDGETIAIKINMNQDAGGPWGPADGMPSPQVVCSFVDQLINVVGVPGSAISVYDSSRYIGDPIVNKVRSNPDPNFQSVAFVVSPVVAKNGRIGANHDEDNPIHTAAGIAYLPRCVTQAKYLINIALMRPHELYGITLCAKNHFGSIRFPSTSLYQGWTPSPLHNYGLRDNPMGTYNCLVELNGHRHLAGKTLLYFIDALYPAAHQGGNVVKWESFGDDWCSSVFASQDPVAIDSVGLDFLRSEPRCTNVTGNPENYLHEMALADNPPSGTFYDPEQDGLSLTSLGVHEHWNNAVEKKYSRNLGTGAGIELVAARLDHIFDLNGDGIVDGLDVCILVEHWQSDSALCDIAPLPLGDGIVNLEDLTALAKYLFEEVDDPTLIAHWPLDEAYGATAYDRASACDGTLVGGPCWRPDGGIVAGALQLDGIDDYVSTGFLNPADGPFSVAAWVRGGGAGQTIISQSGGANWLSTDLVDGSLMTELKTSGRGGAPLLSETPIVDGGWHRIGFVWDGSSRTLYVDGTAAAEDTQDSLESSGSGLYIGCGKNMEPGTYWRGLIDDVRIYGRTLSP
jgi:hypothetical protein